MSDNAAKVVAKSLVKEAEELFQKAIIEVAFRTLLGNGMTIVKIEEMVDDVLNELEAEQTNEALKSKNSNGKAATARRPGAGFRWNDSDANFETEAASWDDWDYAGARPGNLKEKSAAYWPPLPPRSPTPQEWEGSWDWY
ncbi:350590a8-2366-4094-9e54-a8cee0aefd23 [Thermothielavioides terrestris]|uniref:350590a8-2366-4094-9e54-a8cee0aefd23 n=1 Tax=Thermothielavioides terrestris TaxID=2587410 RepID=A0A3S4AW00_9PEZI|nr:350590a8-2366-4094-9e54-a8cee0aefd23 [Thermothielavioides terrestris]